MSGKISQNDFFKSLERLEALSKGQICTGPNSEQTSWAGTTKESVPQTGEGVGAGQDGDYNAGMRKAIAEKVVKGLPLTAEEVAILKSDFDKAGEPVNKAQKDDDKDDDKKDDKKDAKDDKKDDDDDKGGLPFADMGKSMGQVNQENETIRQGIEVSEFLAEFAKSFATGLDHVVREVMAHVDARLGKFATEQGEFNKSLGEAVVNIGHGISALNKGIEETAQAPAAPPKSQLRALPGGVQALQKSQGETQFSKHQVADALCSLMEKGQCSSLDVVKYESTGQLNPQLQDLVVKSLSGGQQ